MSGDVPQQGRAAILVGQQRLAVHRPGDTQIRIVPAQAELGFRVIDVGAFVRKECVGPGHQIAVGETWRHPELAPVLPGQRHSDPTPEPGGTAADVHRHIEDLAAQDLHQLALGMRVLDVQAAQDALTRVGLIVLYHALRYAEPGITLRLPGLHEPAARVAKDLGFDDQCVRDLGLNDIHGSIPRSSSPIR
jgi:hypothetical protein